MPYQCDTAGLAARIRAKIDLEEAQRRAEQAGEPTEPETATGSQVTDSTQ